MAGVSRHMARSFVSSARAAGRFCGNKPAAAASGEMGAAAGRGGLGFGGAGGPPRGPSPKSFFMESRRPGAFLAGCLRKWHVCNPYCLCTMQQLQREWFRSFTPQLVPSSRTVRTAHSA